MRQAHQLKSIVSIPIIFSLSFLACGEKKSDSVKLKSENDKVSYTIGVQIGQNFQLHLFPHLYLPNLLLHFLGSPN